MYVAGEFFAISLFINEYPLKATLKEMPGSVPLDVKVCGIGSIDMMKNL
jgi:hypothetical protein